MWNNHIQKTRQNTHLHTAVCESVCVCVNIMVKKQKCKKDTQVIVPSCPPSASNLSSLHICLPLSLSVCPDGKVCSNMIAVGIKRIHLWSVTDHKTAAEQRNFTVELDLGVGPFSADNPLGASHCQSSLTNDQKYPVLRSSGFRN